MGSHIACLTTQIPTLIMKTAVLVCCFVLLIAGAAAQSGKWCRDKDHQELLAKAAEKILDFAENGVKCTSGEFECDVELRASGLDDPKPRGDGFIKVNGKTVTLDKGRGFTLAVIHPDCSVGDIRRYDTYGSTAASTQMRDFLNALPANTHIAAITDDSYSARLAPANDVLTKLGVNLAGGALRTSLAFLATKGHPAETVQQFTARSKGPATLEVKHE